MTTEVLMPKIGLTMTEGKIVEWKKRQGEWVEKGEILFVFETEKVTYDVEAQESGFLAKILAQVDDVVPVGKVVAILDEKEAHLEESKASDTRQVETGSGETPVHAKKERPHKIRATPMARRLAKERGLDLEDLICAEGGQRIKMKDVLSAPEKKSTEDALGPAVKEPESSSPSSPVSEGKLVKLSGMRKIIAQKMLASKIEAAQTYMVVSADATNLMLAKEKLGKFIEKETGVRLTITDLLMKITASAIALHPVMNTRWSNEGIIWFEAIHMGMAMALDEGLIVPVILDIGKKSLTQIAQSRTDLIARGKAGKLTPDEMRGSTFTLSSLGMFGIEQFTAIINQPESAILAVGAIMDKPVAVNKEVLVRPIMTMTLSYDHRVIDGAKAAAFTRTLKELVEDPILILA